MLPSGDLEVEVNDRYLDEALEDKTRFLVLYGGSGSGKSVFAAFKICFRTLTEEGHKFLCLRKVMATVKDSIFTEISDMLHAMGCYHEFKVNETEKRFTHRRTGNQILCKGLDDPEKVKSMKGITGMWIEEATEFTAQEIDQLNLRIRGEKKNYIQYIVSFNPISEDNEIVVKFVLNKEPDAKVIHTTHHDNKFLTEEDRAQIEALKQKNPLFYDIYCLGIPGIVDKSGKFLYSFNTTQVKKGIQPSPKLPLWITFDFNIDPMTVSVGQKPHQNKLQVFKNIQLNDSDIYQMTDRIKADYSQFMWIVTGDATGHNRTGAVRGKDSYWKIIRRELGLKDHQMMVRKENLGLIESKVLCNAVNQTCEIEIAEECEQLIKECKFAKVDDKGVLIKDRAKQKNDFLDGFRYLIDANFHDFLDKPHRYKKK